MPLVQEKKHATYTSAGLCSQRQQMCWELNCLEKVELRADVRRVGAAKWIAGAYCRGTGETDSRERGHTSSHDQVYKQCQCINPRLLITMQQIHQPHRTYRKINSAPIFDQFSTLSPMFQDSSLSTLSDKQDFPPSLNQSLPLS